MVQEPKQPTIVTESIETFPNPPPARSEPVSGSLFQSMEELRERHGQSGTARERFWRIAGGFLLGAVLFGALYLVILLTEY